MLQETHSQSIEQMNIDDLAAEYCHALMRLQALDCALRGSLPLPEEFPYEQQRLIAHKRTLGDELRRRVAPIRDDKPAILSAKPGVSSNGHRIQE